jgi:hypothetical protein
MVLAHLLSSRPYFAIKDDGIEWQQIYAFCMGASYLSQSSSWKMDIARIASNSLGRFTKVILNDALAIDCSLWKKSHLFVRDPDSFFEFGFEYGHAFRFWWELSGHKPSQAPNHPKGDQLTEKHGFQNHGLQENV